MRDYLGLYLVEPNGKENIKRYFLVDYENVNKEGMHGISELQETDCVRIYYNNSAESLTFELHQKILHSKAKFDYIHVNVPIKNAVDCQILFDIRDYGAKNQAAEYFIVSKDGDFDNAIEMYQKQELKIQKLLQIAQLTQKQPSANSSYKFESQVRSFFGQNFKEEIYRNQKEAIISLILDSKDKQQLNIGLSKLYPSKTVKEILRKLEPLFLKFPLDTSYSKKLETQVRSFCEPYFNEQVYEDQKEAIICAILEAKNKQQLNVSLTKLCPSQLVKEIFKIIKPLIKNLPGQ